MPAAKANAARLSRRVGAEDQQPLRRARPPSSVQRPPPVNPPRRSPTLLRIFVRYARWYVGRQFHRVRISRGAAPPDVGDEPLVVFVNHAAWWDPLICLLLDQHFFPHRESSAPIDARALNQYRFFERLGFFGVEQGTRRGAVTFLRTAEALLSRPRATLWLTPQGRFADVRERPVRFAAGLGHLACRLPHAVYLPVAIEYPFWEESRPEALVRFGEPLTLPPGIQPDEASGRLESALAAAQDALAGESLLRRPELFTPLLEGGAGVGGIYDLWRRLRAYLTGREFRPEHGTK